MFSLESRPRPLAQGLAADVVFAGQSAVLTTGHDRGRRARPPRRATAATARRPGWWSMRSAARGFTVEVDRFERDGDDLVNVIGRRAGSTRRQIVVVAARDAAGVPDAAGSAADTAALIELARVFEGRPVAARRWCSPRSTAPRSGEVGTTRLADAARIAGPGGRRDRGLRARARRPRARPP